MTLVIHCSPARSAGLSFMRPSYPAQIRQGRQPGPTPRALGTANARPVFRPGGLENHPHAAEPDRTALARLHDDRRRAHLRSFRHPVGSLRCRYPLHTGPRPRSRSGREGRSGCMRQRSSRCWGLARPFPGRHTEHGGRTPCHSRIGTGAASLQSMGCIMSDEHTTAMVQRYLDDLVGDSLAEPIVLAFRPGRPPPAPPVRHAPLPELSSPGATAAEPGG